MYVTFVSAKGKTEKKPIKIKKDVIQGLVNHPKKEMQNYPPIDVYH